MRAAAEVLTRLICGTALDPSDPAGRLRDWCNLHHTGKTLGVMLSLLLRRCSSREEWQAWGRPLYDTGLAAVAVRSLPQLLAGFDGSCDDDVELLTDLLRDLGNLAAAVAAHDVAALEGLSAALEALRGFLATRRLLPQDPGAPVVHG